MQRHDAAGLRRAGNTAVRDTAQVWGVPKIEDDLKVFGNFGHLFANGLQWYGHANYASKTVTGGFTFHQPFLGAPNGFPGGRSRVVGNRPLRRAGLRLRIERLQRHSSRKRRHLGSRQRRRLR